MDTRLDVLSTPLGTLSSARTAAPRGSMPADVEEPPQVCVQTAQTQPARGITSGDVERTQLAHSYPVQ